MKNKSYVWPMMKMSSETVEDIDERKLFRRRLLSWFDEHRREMPWRGTGDPYAVWVSEIMLQQTRVATVVDYFERWMIRFPTVEILSEAPIEDVLEMWSGLGYYRRARHLHRAAQTVVEDFGGELPESVRELKKLSGVGPYTAGAISSIAFGQVEPLVDGNVMRVIARRYALSEDPRKGDAMRFVWSRAREMVDPERPGDFNQGLMELGSLVCTARSPSCETCPVQQGCLGVATGNPEQFPVLEKKRKQTPMRGRVCVVHREAADGGGRQFLLHRRPEEGLLAGLWEFPTIEVAGKKWPEVDQLRKRLSEMALEDGDWDLSEKSLGDVKHVFSHRRLRVRIHEWDVTQRGWYHQKDRWRWVSEEELAGVASSALLGKIKTVWDQVRLPL